ncbi:hypothetical protein [Paenibacillus glacialis]|uniref:Uncharacterized protein n=1 Tax=Paenibacillus glacialis TaxID=494026 RepID=A0A168N0W4_9BACL|nr:hypothetical protein [Paenibacillus glacialis]OAB45265.1 hypothetical protein PGLA_03125 [Paenibacillus glacialis]
MNRRGTGIIFISIGAFLYGIRYISAAIFGSNVSSWNESLFQAMLDSVGSGPVILSVLSFIIGIIYLIISEFGESLKASIEKAKSD